MKKFLLTSLLLLSLSGTEPAPGLTTSFLLPSATTLSAQQNNEPLNATTRVRVAFAWESVTFDATAGGIGLTSATYNPTVTDKPSEFSRAELAVMSCQTAQIRYRVDGGTVTSANGMIVNPGDMLMVYGFANISAFRGIRTGGTSGVCDITYYRQN